jgi:hypothetical protein
MSTTEFKILEPIVPIQESGVNTPPNTPNNYTVQHDNTPTETNNDTATETNDTATETNDTATETNDTATETNNSLNQETNDAIPCDITSERNNTPSQDFNRTMISALEKQVRLVDSDNGLDLFCYIRCEATDSDVLKKCRGVVFNGEKMIMNGFPYTYEYTEDNHAEIENRINGSFDSCSFYDAYEGSLIRMFHFKDKWYISTNRKLDANKSKWSSSESFGYFFKQALEFEAENNENFRTNLPDGNDVVERFQSLLDKDKQYMFLLLNNEQNRIVCTSPLRPTVLHVGTFVNGILSMDENVYIPYAQKHSFSNIDDVYEYVNSVDIDKIQGVIVFAPNNIQYKIFNKKYFEYYNVRGNEPSIKFRYLQVRMDKKYNGLMHYLYPNFSKTFGDYENIIYGICKNIYNAYLNRFIRNQYIKVPPEEFKVVSACHNWHLQDRSINKINLNKIIEIFNEQHPTSINKMIRRFYKEQNDLSSKKTEGDTQHVRVNKYKPLLNRNTKNVPIAPVVPV